MFPREIKRRDDEHVPAAGRDARLQPERLVDRRSSTAWRSRPTSSSKPRCRAGGSRSTSTPTAGRRWCIAPQTQSGSFFNDQEREVGSLQWVEALSLSRELARAARLQGRHRSAALAVHRLQRQPAGRDPPPRRLARRADGVRRPHARRSVSGVEFALFAQDRWRVGSRVTFELGLRLDRDRGRRAGELVAARRRGDRRRARRTGDPARRLRQVRAAHAAQRRGVSVVRAADRRHGSPPTALPLGPPITFANVLDADLHTPEALRRQRRVEPAVRPPPAVQARVPAAPRLARVHRVAGSGRVASCGCRAPARRATGSSRRRRGIWAASGGTSRVSYVWAQGDGRSQQLRSVLRQPSQPDRPRQREQPDSDRRPPSAARARHHRAAGQVGLRAACWSCDRDSRGRRSTSSRTSSARATAPAACPRSARSISRWRGPWRFKKYRFRAGLKLYNVFGASAERDVQNN